MKKIVDTKDDIKIEVIIENEIEEINIVIIVIRKDIRIESVTDHILILMKIEAKELKNLKIDADIEK